MTFIEGLHAPAASTSMAIPSLSGKAAEKEAAKDAAFIASAKQQREEGASQAAAKEKAALEADNERRITRDSLLQNEFEKLLPAPPPPATPPLEKPAMVVQIYPRDAQTMVSTTGGSVPVPLYSFAQLERMSKRGKANIAANLRDGPSASQLPPLNINAPEEQLVDWILNAQVMLGTSAGMEGMDLKSFGFVDRSQEQ